MRVEKYQRLRVSGCGLGHMHSPTERTDTREHAHTHAYIHTHKKGRKGTVSRESWPLRGLCNVQAGPIWFRAAGAPGHGPR